MYILRIFYHLLLHIDYLEAGLKRIKIFPVLRNIREQWFLDCFPLLPGINSVFVNFWI